MIAPALGVPLRFYRPFAEFLAGEGLAVLVADCRGPTLSDWADRDLPEALARLRASAPGVPVAWIGHSMGGQLFGLMRSPDVDRALFVAAQHGHWRNWRGPTRYAMAALWWSIPLVTAVTRRLPVLGIPRTIAREWASWGRDRRYLLGHARADSGFSTYRGPLRSYAISDDRYAPLSTVRPLAAAFTAAQVDVREISPRAYNLATLGHFGPFRPTATALWHEWRAYLAA